MSEIDCQLAQVELSETHDEGRTIGPEMEAHVRGCPSCTGFAEGLRALDLALARDRFDQTPDIASGVMRRLSPTRARWWSIAAAALVGLVAGAVVGGVGTRLEVGEAQDLDELFHTAGRAIEGLSADLLVVERGVHQAVPERVYLGSLAYQAPETLALELVDTTEYPGAAWLPNDVRLGFSNGDLEVTAGRPCPVAGKPGCLVEPVTRALSDLPPFDRGVLVPLEIVGPGRSLTWPSGLEVLGLQEMKGRAAIQVRSTVAAVDLIGAITEHGSWRELHPTDRVVMWLDETTLVPLRIEVFAADSTERALWQLRRGYSDLLGGEEPILIVDFSNLSFETPALEALSLAGAVSAGFVEGPVSVPEPALPEGFAAHRSGRRPLGEGGFVEVATWSDGRSWLMVEATGDWDEPRLFGMSQPYVTQVDLGEASVGYLAPAGDRLAIHTDQGEVVVSGSLPPQMLLQLGSTLPVRGMPVPSHWLEAATVGLDDLPSGTLIPRVEGWATSARIDDEVVSILLTSGGSRSVLIHQREGTRLAPPAGPDVYELRVRGATGRFDSATGTLEWSEEGVVITITSDTVDRRVLLEIAESMRPRR